jgi:hypothetical protein
MAQTDDLGKKIKTHVKGASVFASFSVNPHLFHKIGVNPRWEICEKRNIEFNNPDYPCQAVKPVTKLKFVRLANISQKLLFYTLILYSYAKLSTDIKAYFKLKLPTYLVQFFSYNLPIVPWNLLVSGHTHPLLGSFAGYNNCVTDFC